VLSLSINLHIKTASSLIICNPIESKALKKSLTCTLDVPSKEGSDLNKRGRVAIVFAPFSNNFCFILEMTIQVKNAI
jgi:hypothetical protein